MDAAVFGIIVADVVAEPMDVRRPPPAGGLAPLRSLQILPGGNVCNVGAAMARFGMKVAAAGAVGVDDLGSLVLGRLRGAGVDTSGIVQTERAGTGATVVAVEPGGERCFFCCPGDALLDAGAFRRCFPLFRECRYLLIGYFGLLPALTPELPGLLGELRAAAPRLHVALDTIPPTAGRDLLDPILPHLDVFAPSRPEAIELTGETDPVRMVASFRRQMPAGVIGIKLDADGCYLDDGCRAILAPAATVEVVDTTGAGDAWFAGLLTAFIKGMPTDQAARFANRAGADCCAALGAAGNVRDFEETLARI